MKVVLPVFKKDTPSEDEVVLLRDKTGMLRPAMGNSSVDAGQISQRMFGMHGFTDLIGGAHLSGEVIEFHTMEVKQVLNAPTLPDMEPIQIKLKDLQQMVYGTGSAINIFLNLGIRMYEDFRYRD